MLIRNIVFLCLGSAPFLCAKPLNVSVSSGSAILMNADTGVVLYEKNGDKVSYPASTTKVATALYALEKLEGRLDEVIAAPAECLMTVSQAVKLKNSEQYPSYFQEPDGSSMGLKPGETLSFRHLMYGLMLVSGNDAANVLAHHISGSVPKFVEDLNLFLKQKGIKNTSFQNPHGLWDPKHVTTARDLALIAKEGLKNPTFREIVRTVSYDRPETNLQPTWVMTQSNKLMRRGPHFYPKAIGIKTGYLSKAGYTLVAAAEHEGRCLIAVLLDSKSLEQRYRDAITLFETAFAEKQVKRTLFNKEYDRFNLQVKGAKTAVNASLKDHFTIEYFPAEEPTVKASLHWRHLQLPIKNGDCVAEIRVTNDQGYLLKSAPLFATADVEGTLLFKLGKWSTAAIHSPASKVVIVLGASGLVFLIWIRRKDSLRKQK